MPDGPKTISDGWGSNETHTFPLPKTPPLARQPIIGWRFSNTRKPFLRSRKSESGDIVFALTLLVSKAPARRSQLSPVRELYP